MATELPPPTVDVTPTTAGVDVVIHRDGRGRSYNIVGSTQTELVKDAVKKVLGDHYSAEWIPKG